MKLLPYLLPALFTCLLSSALFAQYPDEDEDDSDPDEQFLPYVKIQEVKDFAELLQQARREKKIIMLEMSASYCGFCKTLEKYMIKPMLRSGDYTQNVLIRKLDIDSYYPMQDLSGQPSTPSKIAYKLGVELTPTLLFLDGRGQEVSERIVGVNTLELFGGYVDAALEEGHRIMLNNE